MADKAAEERFALKNGELFTLVKVRSIHFSKHLLRCPTALHRKGFGSTFYTKGGINLHLLQLLHLLHAVASVATVANSTYPMRRYSFGEMPIRRLKYLPKKVCEGKFK